MDYLKNKLSYVFEPGDQYPHMLRIGYDCSVFKFTKRNIALRPEIRQWLRERKLTPRYGYEPLQVVMAFERSEDMMEFRLTWLD